MKLKICITLLGVTLVAQLQAQKKDSCNYGNAKVICIDFKNKKIGQLPQKMNQGDFYQLRIENINQNRWKVALTSKDSILDTSKSLPKFGDVKLDAITQLVGSLQDITSSTLAVQEEVKTIFQEGSLLDLKKSAIISPHDRVGELLNQEKKTLENYLKAQKDLLGAIDQIKFDIGIKQLAGVDQNGQVTSSVDFSDVLKKIIELRKKVDALYLKIKKAQERYEAMSKKERPIIVKHPDLKKADETLKKSYSQFLTTTLKIKEDINADKAIALLKSALFVRNKKEPYLSMPIQFNGDQAEVKVNFTPRKEEFNLDAYEMSFRFPTQKHFYWSVGASFYLANLSDERFSSRDSSGVFRLVAEENQGFEIGTASLLRFGYKNVLGIQDVGFHGSLGVGVSIAENIRPRILTGVGFAFGKKHSFTVDFGGIVGFVSRKSNAFEVNETFASKPENVTITQLAVGGFVALGYLFKF